MDKKKKEHIMMLVIYLTAIAVVVAVECISIFAFQFVLGFIPQFILICGSMAVANKLVKIVKEKNKKTN